jgi:ABC-2 type transport system permease protein
VITLSSFLTVVGFTFKNKVKSKAFLITSIILVLILSAIINLPFIIQSFSSDEPDRIGMFEEASGIPAMLQNALNQQEEPDFEIILFSPEGSQAENDKFIKDQIEEGDISGFLELQENPSGDFPNVVYKSADSLEFSVTNKLSSVLSNIKIELAIQDMNITPEQRERLFSPISIENVQIGSSGSGNNLVKSESEMFMAYGLVYVLIILQFMATMISGQLIATDITAEKSSRVMEILVTSVTPLKQMFGKIIGMLLLGLSQIALFILVIMTWLSAKIYRTGVLMYGKRPSFKELRKAMKAFKV